VVAEALELLASGGAAPAALASCLRHDPVLSVRLRQLEADAKHSGAPDGGQSGLLRAMLLAAPVANGPQLPGYAVRWRTSLTVAALARALAERSGLAEAEPAWLAGLTHNLAAYAQPAGPDPADMAERSAGCLEELDAAGWLADAVRYHALPLASARAAHPLLRITQLAYVLTTRPQAADSSDVRAALGGLGMSADEGAGLLLEAQDQVQEWAQRFSLAGSLNEEKDNRLVRLLRIYSGQAAQSALHGYLRNAKDTSALLRALKQALSALFGVERACVFVPQADGLLRVSPLFDSSPSLSGLAIPQDDGQTIALKDATPHTIFHGLQPIESRSPSGLRAEAHAPAIFDGAGISVLSRAHALRQALYFDAGAAEFSVADAQIARRLGVSGFLCQPVMLSGWTPALLLCGEADFRATEGIPEKNNASMSPQESAIFDDARRASDAWRGFVAEWGEAFARLDMLRPFSAAQGSLQEGGSGDMSGAAAGRRERAEAAAAADDKEDIPRERVRRAVHEVANPLTIMRNYVNLLSDRLGSDSTVQRDLGIISEEIDRVARIVRGITAVEESPATTEAEQVSVNSIVSELVRMTLGTLLTPNKVSVQIDLNPEVPPMPLHKDPLKQVLFNLAKNAVEAMRQGGHLKFTTRMSDVGGLRQVEIEVADTGPGLPEQVYAHLFEPIVSSKDGDHAGLGLSISRSLVARMGGSMACESSSQGARFLIRLPVPQATPTAARHDVAQTQA
jgi:signal transduction histidine kinase